MRVDIARLDKEVKAVLGVSDADALAIDAVVKELTRLRPLNPKAWQDGILLLISTLMVAGDTVIGTSGADLVAKVERLRVIQKELAVQLEKLAEEQVAGILERLGLGEEHTDLPKEKVN